MGLFNVGEFVLHSGDDTNFLIDCDVLTDDDLAALAIISQSALPEAYGTVVGIPEGGMRFAKALERYITPGAEATLLVDDVLTTGASMWTAAVDLGEPVYGLVIFARGLCPNWVTPLFSGPNAGIPRDLFY